jgi:hypothetical protein
MESIALFIPILALSIPIVAIITSAITRKYKYLAESKTPEEVSRLEARIQKLEETIASLTNDVAQIEEKQEFVSRLLEDK